MAGLLRQGIERGEIPEQNVELCAAALVGAIAESLVGPLSPARWDAWKTQWPLW